MFELYRKSLRHIVPGAPPINSPHKNLRALDQHHQRLGRFLSNLSTSQSRRLECATRSSKVIVTLQISIRRAANVLGSQAFPRHNSKGTSHTTPPHNQTFRLSITRVSPTQVCVSLDQLLTSSLLVVLWALYPGIGPQALFPGIETQAVSPTEHHRRQPESRASRLSQEEQLGDDMPVVHPHLEERYEPPPSQLPKKERRHFRELGRDLGRRFFHFVGIRKESPQPKRRSVFYHTASGS